MALDLRSNECSVLYSHRSHGWGAMCHLLGFEETSPMRLVQAQVEVDR